LLAALLLRGSQDFFVDDEGYMDFLDLTIKIAEEVEVVGMVEHKDVQRPRGRRGGGSLFEEDYR